MKRSFYILIYTAVFIMPGMMFSQAGVTRLRYTDPYEQPQTAYQEWCLKNQRLIQEPFAIGKAASARLSGNGGRAPLVDIVVYAPLYPYILDSLNLYVSDIVLEAYDVRVDTVRGWNATGLRSHLAALLDSELVGAVFIGNVPFAWYEYESAEGREEFPIELFLMDLDGTWVDSDTDHVYDGHTGDRAPEIWVGRINCAMMTWGNEIYLTNNYLSKIHRYRTGGYSMPQKALAYDDDDWSSFGDCDLDYLYDTVVVVNSNNTTTAADFRNRLDDHYEWVQVNSHSSPWANTFKNNSGYAGTVFNFEEWFADPTFLFVNLFQCSGTRFIEENFIGGCYIYNTMNGLLAIGSAKVGSMLHFSDFYGRLDTGISIGAAFEAWFAQWGITDVDWFYGMCICGDPLLKPKQTGYYQAGSPKRPVVFNSLMSWSNPQPVDLHAESDAFVSTIVDGQGRLWASWVTGRSTTYGRTEICASRRQASGSWTTPAIIDAYEYWDFSPILCCDSLGRATVSWARCFGRNYDIFNSYYTGSAWSAGTMVSSMASNDMYPAMTLDGDNRLWVTLERWTHLNGDIYCRYYNGSAWQPMFAVTVDSANDYRPSMATDSSGIAWVAWTSERWEYNRNIYVKNYNPVSGHWENLHRLTSNQSQDQDPKICVDGSGTVWVVWTTWRNGNSDIYGSHYDGVSWSNAQPVASDSGRDEHPVLVTDRDGYLWCIWQSDRSGAWEIMAKYYKDDAWRDSSAISASTYKDIMPAATLDDSGYVWVLWQTNRNGSWDIYSSRILSDLIPPEVAVVAPNGGEMWNIGDVDTIRWTATDNITVDTVSLWYSTNNGSSWINIAHGLANSQVYAWTVPPTPSTQCLVRAVAYDRFPNAAEDVSDAVFTIRDAVLPVVTVHYPNGGEEFSPGEIDTVRWLATDNIGLDSVALLFSPDSGQNWTYLVSPPVSDTMYEWTVPYVHSDRCLIKAEAFDMSNNGVEDVSDSVFRIIDTGMPFVEVLVPNGGEVWYWDEVRAIQWLSMDNVGIDSANIHLSLDGGATFPVFVAHIAGNDSSFDWTIPETTSYECLIRVTSYDVAGNSVYDVSDSLFIIGQVGIAQDGSIPRYFAVYGPSPNPWTDKFCLRLQLPQRQYVKIFVYDASGRLTGKIADKLLEAGYYRFDWNGNGLSAGIYFVTIETGEYQKTVKTILVE